MIQLCHQIIHYDLGRTYYKEGIKEKIKTIHNKTEQNKAQYNLDRQTAKLSALSLGIVIKYEFLTGKDVLPEKDLVEKAAALKRFECSPLGKELKKQINVAEKQYKNFDKIFNPNETEQPVTTKKEITDKSSLPYNNKFSFIEFKNIRKYKNDSLVSRFNNYLPLFKQ